MSDGKLFVKTKSVELRTELERALKKSKPQARIKVVLKKVLANIILNNNEIIKFFPDIISLMKFDDFEIRKMCFQYLVTFASSSPKDAHDALPFLVRFEDEPDPLMKALALKTLSSIPNKDYVNVTFNKVISALHFPDPHVRKAAAFAVSRLFQHDQERATQLHLLEDLNELLYDSNETVVANALASLSYITENGKTLSLTIDKKHSLALLSYLGKTNEWCQIYILSSLMAYVPQTTEEALDLIEATIPSLQHENSAVILNAIKIIVYFSHYVKNPELVIPTLSKKLGSSLVSLLSKPPETQFLALRNVILLLLGRKELLSFDIEMFFCRYDDPIYIKDTKLEIIYLAANEQNVHVVLRELEEYATEVDVAMARKAIRAFGNLAVKLTGASDECVDVICDLISNGISYIVQESTIVIKNILRKYPGRYNFAIKELMKHYKVIDEPEAKTAMIWILGQYCEHIEKVEFIMGDFISTFKDDPIEVQYAILTAATKLYLKLPERGEGLILKVLKWATEEVDNPDIRDRGFIYWRLLSAEDANGADGEFQANTKKVILNSNPVISTDSDNIDPTILEELELNIGTLASIYLKPILHVFRLAKPKSLPYSPALQRRQQPNAPVSTNASNDNVHLTHSTAASAEYISPRRISSPSVSHSSRPSRHLPLPRQESDLSSNEDNTPKKSSFAKRLTRQASILTGRKNK